jgi:hypothetical protein
MTKMPKASNTEESKEEITTLIDEFIGCPISEEYEHRILDQIRDYYLKLISVNNGELIEKSIEEIEEEMRQFEHTDKRIKADINQVLEDIDRYSCFLQMNINEYGDINITIIFGYKFKGEHLIRIENE